MTATTYDASELYPYYEKALQKTLLNRRLIPALKSWPRLPPDKWPQEYVDLQEKMEKELIIRFGNFPLLIIDKTPHALFWKQVAHKLGATYTTLSVAKHLLRAWLEYTIQRFDFSPLNIEYLKPLTGLTPLLCLFGDMANFREEEHFYYKGCSRWVEQRDIECSYYREMVRCFYGKAQDSNHLQWGLRIGGDSLWITGFTFWEFFSIPSMGIEVEYDIVHYTNIAEKEAYTTYFENICTWLQAPIAYMQQNGIATLPLRLPDIPDEVIAKAKIRWSPSLSKYYSFPPATYVSDEDRARALAKHKPSTPALPPAVQRLLTSGKIQQTPQVQASPAPAPALPPAPSVAPVPEPNTFMAELEKEIQQRLALKRA